MWRGEKSFPYWDSNSDPSATQPIACCYTYCAIPVPSGDGETWKMYTFEIAIINKPIIIYNT
jgi:hypothetical protein